jgi:hypothetical protein
MEENYLTLDINELVGDRIKTIIDDKNKQIANLSSRLKNANSKIKELRDQRDQNDNANFVLQLIRKRWERDKDVNDVVCCYNLISDIMHTLGFSPTRSVCITSHGSFVKALIINYYDDREILRIVFKELGLNQAIELLDDYILPVHMSKGRLMDFIRNPKYLVNGENYEWGACNYIRLKEYPLSEWCKNPYINDPDVEEEILKTIREKRGKWVILVRIDQYVKIDDNLLNNIAKLLVNRMDQSSNVGDFFTRNLTKLSDEVQESLFSLVTTDDNTYKTFNFRKLSPTSKVKYLDTLPIEESFEIARIHMNPEEAVNYIIKRHEQEKNNPPLPTC